jgi:hypothetical protein
MDGLDIVIRSIWALHQFPALFRVVSEGKTVQFSVCRSYTFRSVDNIDPSTSPMVSPTDYRSSSNS